MLDCVGYFGEKGRRYEDKDVYFHDGILYLIFKERVITKYLNAEFNKPISLKEIAEKYPLVRKVIFDDAMKGVILNYMNHPAEGWEAVGTTIGYA